MARYRLVCHILDMTAKRDDKWAVAEAKTKVDAGGRVVLPSGYRKALGVEPGDEVVLVLEEGEVRVLTPAQAVARAQALVRRYVPAGSKLVDELIRERRAEAKRE